MERVYSWVTSVTFRGDLCLSGKWFDEREHVKLSWLITAMIVIAVVCDGLKLGESITIKVQDNSPVDIVLTAGNTSIDPEEFREGLKPALVAAGVPEDRFVIKATESTSSSLLGADPEEILHNWTGFGDGYWKVEDGKLIDSRYHCGRSGFYNSGWELKDELADFTIEADVMGNASLKNSEGWMNNYFGFIFRVTGYARNYYAVLWEDCVGSKCGQMGDDDYCAPYGGMSIIKVQECDEFDGYYDEERCKQSYTAIGRAKPPCQHGNSMYRIRGGYERGRKYHLKLEWEEPGTIRFYVDGDLKMEVTDPDPLPPGAWGVMSVTHANSGAPSAAIVTTPGVTGTYFENLSVSTGETTDLIELVRAPDFRRNSHKFVVDLCDVPREDFEVPEKVAELAQRLGVNDLYYVGVGNNETKPSMLQLIYRNAGKGAYVGEDYYNKVAAYIASVVNKPLTSDQLLLLKDYEYNFSVM